MSEKTRSADIMLDLIDKMTPDERNDPQKIKKAGDAAKKTADKLNYTNDILIYRIAIGVLGSLSIIAAIGSIILVSLDKTTPEVLVALGSAAVGALVGLFAPSPVNK
jgi:hypothetical protein